jgi:hypothetical protein
MLDKTLRIFCDKLNPILFTSTGQQINRTCINISSMKIPAASSLCYKMVALLPMKVVIYHKLRIQQFHENRLIILQEII